MECPHPFPVTIAIDTETHLASNDEPVPRLVCVSAADESGGQVLTPDPPTLRRVDPLYALLDLALRSEHVLVFANAPFDVNVLCGRWPELFPLFLLAYQRGQIADVLTREKLIDIAEGYHMKRGKYSLADVASRRAGIELDKSDPWRMRYAELDGVLIEQWPADAVTYARRDAEATLATYQAQEIYRAQHTLDVFEDAPRQARKHFALYAQTLRGIHTDQEQVERVARRLDARVKELGESLVDIGLARWKGKKSPKIVCDTKAAAALMRQWCAERGVAVLETEKGGTALSAEAMEKAAIPVGHPLDQYREYKGTRTLRSKTIPILRRPIIRTRYDECKDTGRTGSSAPQGRRKIDDVALWEWAGTNLQNQPKSGGFRECLVPPPGCLFVITDYSGLELCTFAQCELDLLGRSVMAESIRAGRDLHADLACEFLGMPYEQFDKSIPEHKAKRQYSKPPNFGFLGGMGVARFVGYAAGMGQLLTEHEARHAKRVWLHKWQTQAYFDHHAQLQEFAGDAGITVVQHRSNRIRSRCSFSEACNTRFQGLAADGAGSALWRLYLAGLDRESPMFGAYQCLFVHDENVTVCRREDAERVATEQERIMVEAMQEWTPDVPITVETEICERYPSKF